MAGAVSESDSEDVLKEEAQWTAVYPRNKCSVQSAPALVTTGNMNNCQLPHETSDEVGCSGAMNMTMLLSSNYSNHIL